MKYNNDEKSKRSGLEQTISRLRSFMSRPGSAIIIFLCSFLVIGLWVVTDYGESWDEEDLYEYARNSLVAYEGKYRDLNSEKGPFFVMVALLGARIITPFTKGWREIDALHCMTYLSYLMGLFFFYRFCRRLVSSGTALGATALFGTQPLLWGHAFMNPKDIPFMSFFLGSVTLGLEMVDAFNRQISKAAHQKVNSSTRNFWTKFSSDWRSATTTQLFFLIVSGMFLICLMFDRKIILEGIAWIIRQSYTATSSSWLEYFFSRIAQNADQVPLEAYILKGQALFIRLALPFTVGFVLVILFQIYKIFNNLFEWIFFGRITQQTIFAGFFLGFSSAIRVLGPASGLLVGVYFMLKSGRKAISTLLLYFCIGAMVTYLTWPGLWDAPLKNYISSLNQASDFSWPGKVYFNGNQYSPRDLPASYLPTLIGSQFSETALALILFGAVLSVIKVKKDPDQRLDILIITIWFLAPISQAIIFRTTLYDNFRHLLFVIPPLFVFSSLSFQKLSDLLKNRLINLLIIMLALLPGVYWLIQLHPYEYIYYNGLVGGIKGAFRRFEMDYWATSYKEAVEYLNQVAPENSLVLVREPSQIAKTHARSDLIIQEYPRQGNPLTLPNYVLITSRNNEDLTIFPELLPVYKVIRAGATLAVVKQISSPISTEP